MAYLISKFADMSGVSRKTLRYYDQIGLLKPAAVDPRTGYRRYVAEQLQELAGILSLKELGASLPEILELRRRRGSPAEREKLLEGLKEKREMLIEQNLKSLRGIDAALQELTGTQPTSAVVVKRRPPALVASVRSRVDSYEEMEAYQEELTQSLPPECIGSLRGVLWHACADSGYLEGEAFVQLTRSAPRGFYQVKELPTVRVACAYSSFDNSQAECAYDAVRRWMEVRGYRLAGAKRELQLGEMLEIQFPLEVN